MIPGLSQETVASIDAQLDSVKDYLGRIDRRWDAGEGPPIGVGLTYLAEKAEQLQHATARLRRDLEVAVEEVSA